MCPAFFFALSEDPTLQGLGKRGLLVFYSRQKIRLKSHSLHLRGLRYGYIMCIKYSVSFCTYYI